MPGAKFILTPEEMAALEGADDRVFRLYIVLRSLIDFASGTVGKHRAGRVSWVSIATKMRIDPRPGPLPPESPGKDAVYRAAQHLVKRGLVVMESEDRALMMRLPLAFQGPKEVKYAPQIPTRYPLDTHASASAGETTRPSAAVNPLSDKDSQGHGDNKSAREPTRPEGGTDGEKPANNLSSVVCNTNSSSSASNPRTHEDLTPLLSVLADLNREFVRCNFRVERVRGPKTVAMLRAWTEAGVTPDDVRTLVERIVTSRPNLPSIGPEYLAGPMSDHLATKHRHSGQASAANGHQGGEASTPARSTYTHAAESAAEDRAEHERIRELGAKLGIERAPDENVIAYEMRVIDAERNKRRPSAIRPKRAPTQVGAMLCGTQSRGPSDE